MLNFYYIYAVTWGTILFLYLLGWSSLNGALNPVLLIFFLLTTGLSVLLGKRWSNRFRYVKRTPPKMSTLVVVLILGCGALGFEQLGYIPALGFFDQSYDYQELLDRESSIFMTVGVVGSVFGVGYQFARLLEKRDIVDITKLALFALYLFAFSSRGPLFICGVTCLILYCSRRKFKLTPPRVALLVLAVIIGLWAFGVLGNIRTGSDWNDSSYIYLLGYFEGRWPDFIPKEYCWAYSYLTTPLANLNYSLTKAVQIDPINFIYDFLPMMLAKRLPLYEVVHAPLQVSYFNVSSVWSNYYMHLNLIGLFLGYLLQMIVLEVGVALARGTQFENLMMAYCSECVVFSFFVNSFAYPTMGYPAIILAFVCIWKGSNSKERISRGLNRNRQCRGGLCAREVRS